MLKVREEHRCFGGTLGFYQHASKETSTPMNVGVFVPDKTEPMPALYFLAGLTCTEETFLIKAGALRFAAQHGLILVAPDTSPRGAGIAGEDDDWDFGTGAGFYVDAMQAPWASHYRMASYVSKELPEVIEAKFPARRDKRGLFGHSMGGHGALVLALRAPERWHSVSAFAPIANPVAVPWGEKAFSRYLGADRAAWAEWDASLLMAERPYPGTILVDVGTADKFLTEQLKPESLEKSRQNLILRWQEGYDHSYWFIQSFIADHLAHHAKALLG